MNTYIEKKAGKVSVKQTESLCELLRGKMPAHDDSITRLFKEMDGQIKRICPQVTSGALNNVHGNWYEQIIAAIAWEKSLQSNSDYVLLPIPNASQFDVWSLYSDKYHNYIADLRHKVIEATGSQLITSNPDFVIVRKSVLKDVESLFSGGITVESARELSATYRGCIGRCDFDDIKGFLSVKTSMRPDRRLQVCHEGAMMKSLYSHIRTREWVLNAKGLKYYAASTKLTKADKQALKSVAGHSLANVQGLPEPSVDNAFSVDSVSDIDNMVSLIL
ncbi:Cfr10I/Bse634I family restriction endonuclease [Vibrio crassostreae]|uniref:Cfr10I/Bse634I family restriction endonuclease n=1 Tax=Vibrio crassostreae TaxID=246167 RepID=UPI001B300A09|nr:Cfr10I/Bse634I family restriction endonuclease [Vibrio crassostreae]